MTITKAFQSAILSDASYVDFEGRDFTDSDDIKDAINNDSEHLTDKQADDFVRTWRVVDQQPDTSSGFSATLFERINEAGEIIVVYLTFFHCLKFSTTP